MCRSKCEKAKCTECISNDDITLGNVVFALPGNPTEAVLCRDCGLANEDAICLAKGTCVGCRRKTASCGIGGQGPAKWCGGCAVGASATTIVYGHEQCEDCGCQGNHYRMPSADQAAVRGRWCARCADNHPGAVNPRRKDTSAAPRQGRFRKEESLAVPVGIDPCDRLAFQTWRSGLLQGRRLGARRGARPGSTSREPGEPPAKRMRDETTEALEELDSAGWLKRWEGRERHRPAGDTSNWPAALRVEDQANFAAYRSHWERHDSELLKLSAEEWWLRYEARPRKAPLPSAVAKEEKQLFSTFKFRAKQKDPGLASLPDEEWVRRFNARPRNAPAKPLPKALSKVKAVRNAYVNWRKKQLGETWAADADDDEWMRRFGDRPKQPKVTDASGRERVRGEVAKQRRERPKRVIGRQSKKWGGTDEGQAEAEAALAPLFAGMAEPVTNQPAATNRLGRLAAFSLNQDQPVGITPSTPPGRPPEKRKRATEDAQSLNF